MTQICTFCYKTAGKFSWDDKKDGNHQCNSTNILLDRFCNLLERFRCDQGTEKLSSAASKDKFSSALNCCPDCLPVLDTFCSEYHKLKCAELQLEWKLQRLAGIMKLAGRVPSRVVKMKEMFESLDSNTENDHVQNNMKGKPHHSTMTGFKSFRQRIVKLCHNPLKSRPRVWLKRADNFSNITALSDKLSAPQNGSLCSETFGSSTAANEHSTCDVNSIVQPASDALLGWVLSFAAVVILLTFNCRQDSFMINEMSTRLTELTAIDELDQFDSIEDFDSDFREEGLVDKNSLTTSEACDKLEKYNLWPASSVIKKGIALENRLEEANTKNSSSEVDADLSIHAKDSTVQEVTSNPVESLAENSECYDGKHSDSFETETKIDEPEEQEEIISDIKCESSLVWNDELELPSTHYDLSESRTRVLIKMEHDEDLDENVISDNDASNSSTSSDSSMSDGDYEKASRRKKITSPDGNSPNAKHSRSRKCLGRTKRANDKQSNLTGTSSRASTCNVCGKSFTTRRTMKRHIFSAHGTPVICKLCNKPFRSEELLKRHNYNVHIGRTHKCSECDKAFKSRTRLKRHNSPGTRCVGL